MRSVINQFFKSAKSDEVIFEGDAFQMQEYTTRFGYWVKCEASQSQLDSLRKIAKKKKLSVRDLLKLKGMFVSDALLSLGTTKEKLEVRFG